MGRIAMGVALCALLTGCMNTYSRSIVVPATEAASPATAAVDAGEPAPLRPGDVTSPSGWGPAATTTPRPVAGGAPPGFAVRAGSPPASSSSRLSRRPAPNRAWAQYVEPDVLNAAEAEAYRRRCCLWNARRKSNLLTAGVLGGMVVYGLTFFDYGSSPYHAKGDGWFEKDNKDGGSDKWGHALSSHIQTAVFSAINRGWGIPRKEAALRGAITAFSTQFVMEIGDGFSEQFGSSWTDIVANTAGCTFGYFHETSPRFNRLFDFRWEYWPSDQVTEEGEYELSTDIEGSAYLFAINVGALYSRQSNPLDLIDIQVGYFSRHYKDHEAPTERRPFIGVGINWSNVCKRLRLPVLAKLFEYYQPPYTSLRIDTNLND